MRAFRIMTACVALFISPMLRCEVKYDMATVDALTYRFYMERQWDSVILIGKQALRDKIDFYYLRTRMGISYYEKREYIPAITHLRRAREYSSSDPVIAEYLYYACLFSNRVEEANVYKVMPVGTVDKRSSFLAEVHAEGGYTFSSDRDPGNLATLSGGDSIYGEQDLYGNNSYMNLGVKISLSGTLQLSAAYNYLSFDKTRYVQYGRAEAQLDSISKNTYSDDYFYSFPWVMHDTAMNYRVIQHEAYLNLSWTAPNLLRVTPAVHLIHVGYPVIRQSMTDSVSDTAYFLKSDSSWHLFKYPSATYYYSTRDTGMTNWVLSLGFSRRFGIFDMGLTGSWSNLNGLRQKQAGISATCFPLGNMNLYGTTSGTLFFQKGVSRFLFSQVIGARITPWMWGEANFYYGDYTNSNIGNGSVVYNNSDIIRYRLGANLLFLAGDHLRISLLYQYFSKQSRQYFYTKVIEPDPYQISEELHVKTNPYHTQSLILGITWKL